jgi:hypothetical protein
MQDGTGGPRRTLEKVNRGLDFCIKYRVECDTYEFTKVSVLIIRVFIIFCYANIKNFQSKIWIWEPFPSSFTM